MRIEDEIRQREEIIRQEFKRFENRGRSSDLSNATASKYNIHAYSPILFKPSGVMKQFLEEAKPFMKFNSPKIIVKGSNQTLFARKVLDQEEPVDKSFDVLLYTNGRGKWSSAYYLWVFEDGSIALSNNGIYNLTWDDISKKGINETLVRSKIIDSLALQQLENAPSRSSSSSSGGCYIATAVYGSYDCPQVWILRRYRDLWLKKTLPGRIFIKGYYAVSPFLVRCFGNSAFFINVWRKMLDKKIKTLKEHGYSDAPYED